MQQFAKRTYYSEDEVWKVDTVIKSGFICRHVSKWRVILNLLTYSICVNMVHFSYYMKRFWCRRGVAEISSAWNNLLSCADSLANVREPVVVMTPIWSPLCSLSLFFLYFFFFFCVALGIGKFSMPWQCPWAWAEFRFLCVLERWWW